MNAIEFVKKHGINRTKKILDGAPENSNSFRFHNDNFTFGMYGRCENISGNRVSLIDLKQIVEAFEKVALAGGLNEAKRAVAGNYLNASYYMRGGTYFRYGAIGVKIVRDGEYKDYWGGIDSKRLVHLDYLPKCINLVEQCHES